MNKVFLEKECINVSDYRVVFSISIVEYQMLASGAQVETFLWALSSSRNSYLGCRKHASFVLLDSVV